MSAEERAQIVEHVIDAIESDLIMNSSVDKNLTFFKNVRSTEKTMREFSGASSLASQKGGLMKLVDLLERKQAKFLNQDNQKPKIKRTYESISDYNPFLANLTDVQIEKMAIGVSNSIKEVHAPVFDESKLKK